MLRAMRRLTSPLAFAVGALGWTAAEYAEYAVVVTSPKATAQARPRNAPAATNPRTCMISPVLSEIAYGNG